MPEEDLPEITTEKPALYFRNGDVHLLDYDVSLAIDSSAGRDQKDDEVCPSCEFMDDIAGKDDESEETQRSKTLGLAQPVILNILKSTNGDPYGV